MNTGNFARSLLGLGILAAIASSCTAIVGSFDGPGGTGGGAEAGGPGGSMNTGGMSSTTHMSSTMTGTSTHHTSTSTGTNAGGGGAGAGGMTTSSSSSGGGGGGAVGACTDASDDKILTTPGFSVANALGMCADSVSCVATNTGLSSDCSGCFTSLYDCVASKCPNQCSQGAGSQDCDDCLRSGGCLTALLACSGSYCPAARPEVCLGECVDLGSDAAHCGKCGTSCGDASHAGCGPNGCTCNGTACSGGCCVDPNVASMSSCVDMNKDAANCGTCGNACTGGLVCVNGKCSGGCGPDGASCTQSPDCCSGTCDATQHCTQNTGCAGQTRPCNAPSDCCTGFCDATTRTCQLIPQGGACNAATQQFCQPGPGLTIGSCVDGVCCNSDCNGACQACVKTLTGVPDGTCATQNSGSCCSPACQDPGKPCEFATCTNGVCGVGFDMDGTSCTVFSGVTGTCKQGTCYQCFSNADCTGTNVCDQQTHLCGGCTPRTCAQQQYNCGTAPDGCGGTINCGTCTPGDICSGGACGHSCNDNVQDGNETDVDCGGSACIGCGPGQHCLTNLDCGAGLQCNTARTCGP